MRLEPMPKHDHTLRVSARQVASSTMLHFSSDEFEHAIIQEQNENPALEILEQRICFYCGTFMQGAQCISCGNFSHPALVTFSTGVGGNSHESFAETTWNQGSEGHNLGDDDEDEELDPLARIPTGQTLFELLLQQLETLITPEDTSIAEQLVGNLNERGYLEIGLREIAEHLQVPVERVAAVLSLLQTLEPPGIAARDLRECLLLQLQALNEPGEPQALAMLLVDRYLDRLGKGQFQELAHELTIPEQEVRQAVQYIRSTLNPYPAHSYNSEIHTSRAGIAYIRPDVIIRRSEYGYEIELIEEKRYGFHLKHGYDTQSPDRSIDQTIGADMQRYVLQQADLARFFIDCVHRRWHTLKRVIKLVVDYQQDFLAQGIRYLRPLTRVEVATHLKLDEGTVSRAIANKYVLLPNGKLMPIADFFASSLGVKDILRELIVAEVPRRRFSDDELARILTARGIPMARRTVTKYREEMGIPSSRER